MEREEGEREREKEREKERERENKKGRKRERERRKAHIYESKLGVYIHLKPVLSAESDGVLSKQP